MCCLSEGHLPTDLRQTAIIQYIKILSKNVMSEIEYHILLYYFSFCNYHPVIVIMQSINKYFNTCLLIVFLSAFVSRVTLLDLKDVLSVCDDQELCFIDCNVKIFWWKNCELCIYCSLL